MSDYLLGRKLQILTRTNNLIREGVVIKSWLNPDGGGPTILIEDEQGVLHIYYMNSDIHVFKMSTPIKAMPTLEDFNKSINKAIQAHLVSPATNNNLN